MQPTKQLLQASRQYSWPLFRNTSRRKLVRTTNKTSSDASALNLVLSGAASCTSMEQIFIWNFQFCDSFTQILTDESELHRITTILHGCIWNYLRRWSPRSKQCKKTVLNLIKPVRPFELISVWFDSRIRIMFLWSGEQLT